MHLDPNGVSFSYQFEYTKYFKTKHVSDFELFLNLSTFVYKIKNKDMTNETFAKNPFDITGVKRVFRSERSGRQLVVEQNTGEMYEMRKVKTDQVLIDSSPYKKVFNKSLDSVKELSTGALKVWCYVLMNLRQEENYIIIPVKECLIFCGYGAQSRSSYYKSIDELVQKDLIAYSTDTFKFWINTDFFYNGNRLKDYKEDINFENDPK
jgi:hypothetical protein